MRAAFYKRFGPARDVLNVGEMEKPVPGPGEVLVALATSGVNPSDTKKRMGSSPGLLDEGPVIPHSDGAGVIESVGAGVTADRIGQRVWVYQAQHARRFGTAASHVALQSRRAIPLPDNTDFEIGACIGIPVMTAHRCVFADGPVNGLTLLVTGGAGRVGHYAVQWAARAGANVIATASNASDTESCMAAGAAAVVNHRDTDWPDQVLAANAGAKVDRLIDVEFGANLAGDLDVIRTSGTLVSYGSANQPEPILPFYRMMYLDLLIRLVIVYEMPESAKEAAIRDIGAALEQGSLVHRVSDVLPLEEIVQSHERVEQDGYRGCMVLRTG